MRGYFLSMFLFLLTLAGLILYLHKNQKDLQTSQEIRYQSYLRADELRQSSDDLTRYVRTYALTGDPIYETYYWEILDIRNGKKERPESYEKIYWDLVEGNSRPEMEDAKRELLDAKREMEDAEDESLDREKSKFILRTFNQECDNLVDNIHCSDLNKTIKKILNSYEILNRLGKVFGIRINEHYLKSKFPKQQPRPKTRPIERSFQG